MRNVFYSRSPHKKESGKVSLVESRIRETLESWVLESGIQFKESGIRNPSSTTKNPESIIQDRLRFPYTGQCGSCSQMKSLGEWHAFGSSVLNIVHNQLVLLIMSRQTWFVEGEVVIIIIKKVSRLLLGVKWETRCWFKFSYLYAGGSKMVTFFFASLVLIRPRRFLMWRHTSNSIGWRDLAWGRGCFVAV